MDQSKKGFDLIQILSVFLIIVGVVALVLVGNKIGLFDRFLGKKISNETPVATMTESEIKNCNYAKETLDWLDKKRDESGKYFSDVFCDRKKQTCGEFIETGQSGHNDLPIIWARYKYAVKMNDDQELAIVKKDIDLYFKQLDLMEVQNDFWNCKILAEMRDKKVLGEDYVAKIDKLCETSTSLSIENLDVPYLDWENLNEESLTKFTKDKRINSDYTTYVGYPSDYVARYKIWKKEDDLKMANSYFNQLLAEYYLNQEGFSPKDRCLMAISSLDLYSVNQDERYLNWSKGIYRYYFVDNLIQVDAEEPECGFLNREIGIIDNVSDYKFYENKLLEDLTRLYWDGNGGQNSLTKDGGFFLPGSYVSPTIKNLRKNALIVNLLCQ